MRHAKVWGTCVRAATDSERLSGRRRTLAGSWSYKVTPPRVKTVRGPHAKERRKRLKHAPRHLLPLHRNISWVRQASVYQKAYHWPTHRVPTAVATRSKPVCRVSLQRARLPLLHPKASGSSNPAIAFVDECASCVTCSLLFHELCTTPIRIHHH